MDLTPFAFLFPTQETLQVILQQQTPPKSQGFTNYTNKGQSLPVFHAGGGSGYFHSGTQAEGTAGAGTCLSNGPAVAEPHPGSDPSASDIWSSIQILLARTCHMVKPGDNEEGGVHLPQGRAL